MSRAAVCDSRVSRDMKNPATASLPYNISVRPFNVQGDNIQRNGGKTDCHLWRWDYWLLRGLFFDKIRSGNELAGLHYRHELKVVALCRPVSPSSSATPSPDKRRARRAASWPSTGTTDARPSGWHGEVFSSTRRSAGSWRRGTWVIGK